SPTSVSEGQALRGEGCGYGPNARRCPWGAQLCSPHPRLGLEGCRTRSLGGPPNKSEFLNGPRLLFVVPTPRRKVARGGEPSTEGAMPRPGFQLYCVCCRACLRYNRGLSPSHRGISSRPSAESGLLHSPSHAWNDLLCQRSVPGGHHGPYEGGGPLGPPSLLCFEFGHGLFPVGTEIRGQCALARIGGEGASGICPPYLFRADECPPWKLCFNAPVAQKRWQGT